ncbi:MAG: MutS-related protein, partial [Lachnospiraceae bacterium]
MGDFFANPALVTATVLIVLVAVSAALILRENRVQKEKALKKLKKTYGKPGTRKLSSEKIASIGAYARSRDTVAAERAGARTGFGDGAYARFRETITAEGSAPGTSLTGFVPGETREAIVDDITWHDLALDDVFCRIGGTVSDPGDAVLYDWLRHPLLSKEALSARAKTIELFEKKDTLRTKVQAALSGAGRLKKLSYYEAMSSLKDAKPVGAAKFAILGLLTLGSIILFFFQPLIALFVFLALAIVNLSVYISMRDKTGACVTAFGCVLRLIACGRELLQAGIDELPTEKAELTRLLAKFTAFRRGAAFVMAGAQVNTGLGNAVLQYINMFFHLDLISFDRMLAAAKGEEDTVTELLGLLGSLDASCAAAGLRVFLPAWTEGEITESQQASLDTEGLYHPLLDSPVSNNISANAGNLLTGSNASGKSTFLKSLALAAILGQSLATVPANAYRAPFFRVMTSMALSDNLMGGESYFIVEIRSLKRILDAVQGGGAPVLGIVDE